jgi:hypothetical protein
MDHDVSGASSENLELWSSDCWLHFGIKHEQASDVDIVLGCYGYAAVVSKARPVCGMMVVLELRVM